MLKPWRASVAFRRAASSKRRQVYISAGEHRTMYKQEQVTRGLGTVSQSASDHLQLHVATAWLRAPAAHRRPGTTDKEEGEFRDGRCG